MTEKQKLIKAFKALDFSTLEDLLDDNKSYMEVSKSLFLSNLKQELEQWSDLKSYEKVVEVYTEHCNKSCKGYKFSGENMPSLPLYFEENEGKVTDIYLCELFEEDIPDEGEWVVSLFFYEEEKVNFSPSINYLINLQKIDDAINEYKKLSKLGLVPMHEVVYWVEKMDDLAKNIQFNELFKLYKEYVTFKSLYTEVSYLAEHYTNIDLAKKALKKYNNIDINDEKMIVKWLLENEDNYFLPFKKTGQWKNSGILILETEPNLVVDCSEFLEPFLLNNIYWEHYDEIMDKYVPTKEHYEQYGGRLPWDLETHLKVHNKYLELF